MYTWYYIVYVIWYNIYEERRDASLSLPLNIIQTPQYNTNTVLYISPIVLCYIYCMRFVLYTPLILYSIYEQRRGAYRSLPLQFFLT